MADSRTAVSALMNMLIFSGKTPKISGNEANSVFDAIIESVAFLLDNTQNFGDGTAGTKTIFLDDGSANKRGIRFDGTNMQFTDDGTTWVNMSQSANFIPLAGTTSGNPVTGTIEVNNAVSALFASIIGAVTNVILFGGSGFEVNSQDSGTNDTSRISQNITGLFSEFRKNINDHTISDTTNFSGGKIQRRINLGGQTSLEKSDFQIYFVDGSGVEQNIYKVFYIQADQYLYQEWGVLYQMFLSDETGWSVNNPTNEGAIGLVNDSPFLKCKNTFGELDDVLHSDGTNATTWKKMLNQMIWEAKANALSIGNGDNITSQTFSSEKGQNPNALVLATDADWTFKFSALVNLDSIAGGSFTVNFDNNTVGMNYGSAAGQVSKFEIEVSYDYTNSATYWVITLYGTTGIEILNGTTGIVAPTNPTAGVELIASAVTVVFDLYKIDFQLI